MLYVTEAWRIVFPVSLIGYVVLLYFTISAVKSLLALSNSALIFSRKLVFNYM